MTELQFMGSEGNYLDGQLTGTISHLRKLKELFLFGNLLSGHIVPGLGNSSLLHTFDISDNNFSGLFPPSICAGGALHTLNAVQRIFWHSAPDLPKLHNPVVY
jgi:hypothetical protein